jgi:trimeric autotransporter adhesin
MTKKIILGGVLAFSMATSLAQNTSYDQNGIPVLNGSRNAAFGIQALPANLSGDENTAIGVNAMFQSSSGSYNTAVGHLSLFSNQTGNYNTVIGYNADVVSTAGNISNATAIGANAIVTANNTIQFGDAAVTDIFGGVGTTAKFTVGALKVTGGSIGSGKVLTSDASGNATWQTPVLPSTGWSTSGNAGTGNSISFIGTTDNAPLKFKVNNMAAGSINGLDHNIFFGMFSGFSSTMFNLQNSGFGSFSLYSLTNGFNNSAFGAISMENTTTGSSNSAFGGHALYSNTTGGHNAGFGASALFQNTIGSGNTSIGMNSLWHNSTGDGNIGIGKSADVGANNLTNATVIGFGATVNASDKVRIGNSLVTVIEGQVAWSSISDGRFKEKVKENVPGLEFINKLRPVTYIVNTKKYDEHIMQLMPDSIKAKRMQSEEDYAKATKKIQTGFIAQEVEKTAKELGYDFDGVNAPQNQTDNYSIAYSQFIMPLVKALQEQQAMIEELKQEVKTLKTTAANSNQTKNTTAINTLNVKELGFLMEQNIPNPFTSETVINYSLPQTINAAYTKPLTSS